MNLNATSYVRHWLVFCAAAVILAGHVSLRPAHAQTKLAFLAGVEDYEKDGFEKLNFAEDDAKELKVELDKLGFQTVLVTGPNATLKTLESELSNLYLRSKQLKRDDILLVFLSGHGVQKLVGRNIGGKAVEKEEPFFCPINAHKNDTSTLLNLNDLLQRLKDDSGSSNNIVLIDACRESLDKGKGIDGSTIEALPNKLALFFAAQSGHRSFESRKLQHGIFSHYLLEGLRGKAADEDDEITLQGLTSYVSKRVQKDSPGLLDVKESEAQQPHLMGNLRGSLLLGKVSKDDAGSTITNTLGMKLVLIKAGSFMMGSPTTEADRSDDELQHRVTLTKDYYFGTTEVTQGQWESLMGTKPWQGKEYIKEGANYPATYVSWDDAVKFCRKLSEREGKNYRLPTEAEWEYACRAGTTTAYSFGEDPHKLSDYGWWGGLTEDGNAKNEQYAHEVATKRPNGYGLYDMHGNAWEWCWDIYGNYPSGAMSEPRGLASGVPRVHRGGGWNYIAACCRSAERDNWPSDQTFVGLGFRVVLER